MAKKISVIILAIIIAVGAVFYLRYQVYFSHGSYTQNKIFKISKGDGNAIVGQNLEKDGLVSNSWYFYFYIRTHGLLNKLYPGDYLLSGNMTIPEIAAIVTNPQKSFVRVTFIEGWTAKIWPRNFQRTVLTVEHSCR